MVLYLNNAEVRELLPIDDASQAIDDLFRLEAEGHVVNRPTTELPLPRGFFRLKAGLTLDFKSYGFKAYGTGRYMVFVYSTEDNSLTGIVDAHGLTEIRTAAVSTVATKYMARPDTATLAIIGTGREARAQIRAVTRVRPIKKVRAYSRSAEKRETYAREMSEALGLDVTPVASAEECVHDADMVLTITNARDPVFPGSALAKGTFICAVGATTPERRELDEEAVRNAGTVVVEHLPQASAECGELLHAVERGELSWSNVKELKDVVSGVVLGRASPAEINLFDSIGVGSEDVALATFVLNKARELHRGQELPL